MKKSSLKDWFKVEVWRQSGGTLPELCDLAEIREWLNETADDPDLVERISIVETAVSNMQPPPTVIDLSDAEEEYVIEDGKNSIVVVSTAPIDYGIILPATIVGLRVTIINQDQNDEPVDIHPADGEHINGSDIIEPFPLLALTSATFYCYADGHWATI